MADLDAQDGPTMDPPKGMGLFMEAFKEKLTAVKTEQTYKTREKNFLTSMFSHWQKAMLKRIEKARQDLEEQAQAHE
jgi:hypothetical protein